jgi:hypothetical protein
MSYRVIGDDTGYDILEKDTDVVIELKLEEKQAKDYCRKLNLGSGFAGWTPTFFAGKI